MFAAMLVLLSCESLEPAPSACSHLEKGIQMCGVFFFFFFSSPFYFFSPYLQGDRAKAQIFVFPGLTHFNVVLRTCSLLSQVLCPPWNMMGGWGGIGKKKSLCSVIWETELLHSPVWLADVHDRGSAMRRDAWREACSAKDSTLAVAEALVQSLAFQGRFAVWSCFPGSSVACSTLNQLQASG